MQIDIEEDGTILIYATDGTKAAAAIAAITASRSSPEVGDEYHNGKVVKTTQFGAFVELKKGTDGLLHVSNVGPGRVGHIEDVISRGDVLDVEVQEVDKERGRIGLKLVAKHENGSLVQPGGADRAGEGRAPARARGAPARRGDRRRRRAAGGPLARRYSRAPDDEGRLLAAPADVKRSERLSCSGRLSVASARSRSAGFGDHFACARPRSRSMCVNVMLLSESKCHRLRAGAHAELPENALNVGGHGLRTDEKSLGDLFLSHSGGQVAEHLTFARRQRPESVTGVPVRAHCMAPVRGPE